ncbi:MAG: Crp/Fnr family transcriptional regulator [Prolixibacteraceae bacterium]|nr:Crp/Fnr family transcriptional regulator [Prolixibacteraceae bacterium]
MLKEEIAIKKVLENPKSIFSLLKEDEKKRFMDQHMITICKKNEFIYREGDKPTSFIFLIEGKVKIFKEGIGGREQIIRMTKSLGLIGYRSLLAEELHNGSAVTLEDSLVLSVFSDFFFHTMLKNTEVCKNILKKLAQELGFSNSRTVTLTQKHIRGRLAESILLLKNKYGFENDGISLKAYLSREDIANLSNMTTSNAIRTLSTFAGERVISIDGRKIKILNLAKLQNISKKG